MCDSTAIKFLSRSAIRIRSLDGILLYFPGHEAKTESNAIHIRANFIFLVNGEKENYNELTPSSALTQLHPLITLNRFRSSIVEAKRHPKASH